MTGSNGDSSAAALERAWRSGVGVQECRLAPSLDAHLAQLASRCQLRDTLPSLTRRHAVVVRQVGGRGDAVRACREPNELALRVLARHGAAAMLVRYHALRQIVRAREPSRPSLRDRDGATGEMALERGLRHRPSPPSTASGARAVRFVELSRDDGPAGAYRVQYSRGILRVRIHELRQRPPASFVRVEMVPNERPVLDGKDGRLVRPLLGELAVFVDERIEPRAVVRPEAGEGHLIVRRKQHVHGVDLNQTDLTNHAPQVTRVHRSSGSRAIESLGSEYDAPSFA